MDSAVDYINQHDIGRMMATMFTKVTKMKPDNPALFLKDYLLAELAKRDAAVAPQNRWAQWQVNASTSPLDASTGTPTTFETPKTCGSTAAVFGSPTNPQLMDWTNNVDEDEENFNADAPKKASRFSAVPPSPPDMFEKVDSATRIQTQFRGHCARGIYTKKIESRKQEAAMAELLYSATLIQARYRGFFTRWRSASKASRQSTPQPTDASLRNAAPSGAKADQPKVSPMLLSGGYISFGPKGPLQIGAPYAAIRKILDVADVQNLMSTEGLNLLRNTPTVCTHGIPSERGSASPMSLTIPIRIDSPGLGPAHAAISKLVRAASPDLQGVALLRDLAKCTGVSQDGYPDLAKVLKASDAHLLNAGQPLFLLGLAMNREDMGCYGHEAPEADSEDGGDTEFPALAKLLSLSDPKPGQPLSLLHQAMASRAEDGVCSGDNQHGPWVEHYSSLAKLMEATSPDAAQTLLPSLVGAADYDVTPTTYSALSKLCQAADEGTGSQSTQEDHNSLHALLAAADGQLWRGEGLEWLSGMLSRSAN
uniref:RIIa domain-containing protein n=1 Tax=Eutreptiella gymnastica TaxID=73025 RepID=A0A7S4GEG5_9EUGL